jgi:hypothetical protein
MGNLVGTASTEAIAPGASQILDFQWSPPNPVDYSSFGGDQSHFCLLSRIENAIDTTETSDLASNVLNNNAIVWKNVSVATDGSARSASVSVSGAPEGTTARFVFTVPSSPRMAGSVFDWGVVTVDLGPSLFSKWTSGGSAGTSVQPSGGTTIRLLSSGATIANIDLGAQDLSTMTLHFDPSALPSQGLRSVPDVYLLDVKQYSSQALVGGQRFELKTQSPVPPQTEPPPR